MINMGKITIEEDVTEMFSGIVKGTKSMTYISASKKFLGKKVKVLVLEDDK